MESGETVLRGSAHYPHCVDPSGDTFQNLLARLSPQRGDCRLGQTRYSVESDVHNRPYRTDTHPLKNKKTAAGTVSIWTKVAVIGGSIARLSMASLCSAPSNL